MSRSRRLFRITAWMLALAALGCAKKPAPAPAAQSGPNHVIVTAQDYSFTAPDSISAGLEMFHLVNKGPQFHHLQIVALDSAKTAADLMNAMKNPGPPPAWARFVGGPNSGLQTGTDTVVAWLTLPAGNYALLCLIPDTAGVPHFAHGMVHALTVTPSSATPAAEPAADVVIHLKDYTFEISGTLTPGAHTIRVVNDGPQMHEMFLAQLAPGKKASDLVDFVEKDHLRGTPPGRAMGGSTVLMPGASEEIAATFTPGNFGLFCFVPGPDGKDHVLHGMVKELKIGGV